MRNHIVFNFAGGIGFWLLFLVIQCCFGSINFSLPCLMFGTVMIVSAGLLLYNCIRGNFVCVQGVCVQVEVSGIRKRIKSFCLDTGQKLLKVSVCRKIYNLDKGDTVTVYLSDKAPVYEREGGCIICSYYALAVRKEVRLCK